MSDLCKKNFVKYNYGEQKNKTCGEYGGKIQPGQKKVCFIYIYFYFLYMYQSRV